jgi:hypothetical protein
VELTDSRKSQSVASPGRGQQICAGSPVTGLSAEIFALRWSSSVEISEFFQICPRPLQLYIHDIHLAQKLPTQPTRSIFGGPAVFSVCACYGYGPCRMQL